MRPIHTPSASPNSADDSRKYVIITANQGRSQLNSSAKVPERASSGAPASSAPYNATITAAAMTAPNQTASRTATAWRPPAPASAASPRRMSERPPERSRRPQ